MFKEEIAKLIAKEVKLKKEEILSLLEVPPQEEMGDFAFPCFKLGKNPVEEAGKLAGKISKNKVIERVEQKGPYLNFFVKKEFFVKDTLVKIQKEKKKYGFVKKNKKKILVEYSAPNTNKPQHLGHVRNNLTGMAVSNLLESQGYGVVRLNWINDRGIHICKSMLAYIKWGKGKKPNKKTDHFVGDFYVKFAQELKKNPKLEEEAQELLKKWEAGDSELRKLWKKMNGWTYEGFKETYQELGCEFDKWFYESEIFEEGKKLVLKAFEKKILEKDEQGNILANLEKYNLGKKVLLRADGTSIYSTADIALGVEKAKYKPFKSLYVVGNEQKFYFQQLFKILELFGLKDYAKVCKHLNYGMIFLPEGKMKSREGKVIDADDLMQEMVDEARKEIKKRHKKLSKGEVEKRAKMIGLGALKFFTLKFDVQRDFVFDPEESISFEGETGPYVQYTHARICSILRKAKQKISTKISFEVFNQEEEIRVVKLLGNFPQVVEKAAEDYKPHLVARYLIDLAQTFNEFYHKCPVISEMEQVMKARLLLVDSVRQILENGLKLLGISAPEEM
ncbi:arginine--tRNA ligase [Nanoarchaeota archaeon]